MQRFASNPFLSELGLISRHTFSSWLFYMPKLLKLKINTALLCTCDNMVSSLFPSFFSLLAAHETLFNPTPLLLEFKLVILGSVNLKYIHITLSRGCLAPRWHHDTKGCSCVGVCSSRGMAILSNFDKLEPSIEIQLLKSKIQHQEIIFLAFPNLTVSNVRHFVTLLNRCWCKGLLTLCECV